MKTRDRLVLGILALAGLMGALWFGVLAPKREEVASLGDKITAAEQRRDAANTKAVQAEQARSTYGRDYARVVALGKATPPQADVASLVYQLESAARHAKVDFRSVSVEAPAAEAPAAEPPAEKAPAGKAPAGEAPAGEAPAGGAPSSGGKAASNTAVGITPVPFSFTFEGDFLKLHDLLRAVDRFSLLKGQAVTIKGRLLTLDSVTLSPGRAGLPQVKAEITARAYVAPIPDQLTAGGEPPTASAPDPATATQVTK